MDSYAMSVMRRNICRIARLVFGVRESTEEGAGNSFAAILRLFGQVESQLNYIPSEGSFVRIERGSLPWNLKVRQISNDSQFNCLCTPEHRYRRRSAGLS